MAFNLFKPAPAETHLPYSITYWIHPLRMKAHSCDYAALEVTVKNSQSSEALTSVVVLVPKGLGFDGSGLSQKKEVRLGMLAPGEEKMIPLKLWANQRSQPGKYTVKIFVLSHYRDYSHTLNQVRHTFSVRLV
jgi:uncharacterized membrane protein